MADHFFNRMIWLTIIGIPNFVIGNLARIMKIHFECHHRQVFHCKGDLKILLANTLSRVFSVDSLLLEEVQLTHLLGFQVYI